MDKSELEEVERIDFYPAIWEILRAALNCFFVALLLFILAAADDPSVLPLTFVFVAIITISAMMIAWWEHYRILSLGDCLAITCVIGCAKQYQWSELKKAFICHHSGWIGASYDLLEFNDSLNRPVRYYLSDLPPVEYKMALAVLRTKLPGLREIYD